MAEEEKEEKTDVPEDEDIEEEEEKEEEEETEEEPEEKKEEEEKEEKEVEIGEPEPRRSAKDFIIQRKDKKIKKLEKEKEEGEDEFTPEGKGFLRREVESSVKPILDTVRKSADSQELQEVLNKYPEAKKMEKDIKKWMEHPAYSGASIEMIFLGLAAKKFGIGTGADQKKKEADDKAKKGKIGGHGRRAKGLEGDIPDVRKMSDKDFDDLTFKVKTGQFKPQ